MIFSLSLTHKDMPATIETPTAHDRLPIPQEAFDWYYEYAHGLFLLPRQTSPETYFEVAYRLARNSRVPRVIGHTKVGVGSIGG